jgi:hypothetical protein
MNVFQQCFGAVALLAMSAVAAQATTDLPEHIRSHADVSGLLERKVVTLQATGRAALAYEIALDMIRADDFLHALQVAYAEMLPEGQSPEFTVQQTAPGKYAYVNRDGEHTTITEIHREIHPGHIDLFIFSTGDRFFGSFEALTAITVKSTDVDHEVDWAVRVYAYPRNVLSRLVARTGVVNRFFRSKTHDITQLAIQIGTYMTSRQPPSMQEA